MWLKYRPWEITLHYPAQPELLGPEIREPSRLSLERVGDTKMEEWLERCHVAGFEDGGMWPWAKACGQPPEARRQSTVSSRASRRKGDLANTLTSAQWDCWRTFNLQKCKIIHLCCFKPSNLWQFVIMAIGNEHILQTQEFWELLFYGIPIKEDKKLYTWFKTVYCYWIYYWIHWLCYW